MPTANKSSTPVRFNLDDCWAKTNAEGIPALGVYPHCLHVGAVGDELASRLSPALSAMVPAGGAFLIAAHDLGKISPGFLLKSAIWRARWQAPLQLISPESYEQNHAKVSQIVLAGKIPNPPLSLLAVGGHHGIYWFKNAKPLQFGAKPVVGEGVFSELREELIVRLVKEFGALPASENNLAKDARLHWFTGLMIFSDWIGSNPAWFPIEAPPKTMDQARNAARQAVDEIGWARQTVRSTVSFAEVFALPAPNSLQSALRAAADSPGLYIVEAPMGGGKTEAAIYAAQRRWSEGDECGLYFALPTQLTSDRIHIRIEKVLKQAVDDCSSIALVHGNSWLTDKRIIPLVPSDSGNEDDVGLPGNRWFSDNRRALLAPFGIGTIDQALMAVLPVKFSALRMFALGGKVVVIDEVHSYDAYTSALVDRAVKWLIDLHCSVIVLSATLTSERRRALVKAAGADDDHSSKSYPLITKVRTGSRQAEAVEIAGCVPEDKTVRIEVCFDLCWLDRAARAAEAGACVLVIRNTVALAQETLRLLKEKCRDTQIQFGCIHSRFMQADRSANEALWVDRLGKIDANRPRHGAILVGTQVLEQSLDIDADLLFTDVAPTDLLLQRIGRLHRHSRPRPNNFERPVCIILMPVLDWTGGTKNILLELHPHHCVYPAYHLYMSERIWSKKTTIRIPSEIREVLEESASIPGDLPSGAAQLLREYQDKVRERMEKALARGPFTETPLEDIEGSQTRWIEQQSAHLVLLKSAPEITAGKIKLVFHGGPENIVIPGMFDFSFARLLQLHSVRLPRYLIRDALSKAPDWLRQHFQNAALAVVDEMNCIDLWPRMDAPANSFKYDQSFGLIHTRNESAPKNYYEDDETWF